MAQSNDLDAKRDSFIPSLRTEIDKFISTINGVGVALQAGMFMSKKVIDDIIAEKQRLLEKHGKLIDDNGAGIRIYQVHVLHTRRIDKADRALDNLLSGANSLPRSQLVAMVSAFDAFMGRLVRWYFLQVPAALVASQKTIGINELMDFGSIDAAKEYFLEKEVESLLRDSHTKQFEWLEGRLGRPLRKNLEIWSEFVEITERRNLLNHTDGRVSRQYLKQCGAAGAKLDPEVRPGDALDVSPKYFGRAREVFYELGVKLGQTVWRIVAPNEIKAADSALTDLIFDLLQRERFRLANVLSAFAVQLPKFSSDAVRRVMIVNRAQSAKWLGNGDEASAILDAEDWSSCGLDYRICVAVLKDDFDEALRLMAEIGSAGPVPEANYLTWPVFREFRESSEFGATFRTVFGHDPTEEVESDQTSSLHGHFGFAQDVADTSDELLSDTSAAQDDSTT